MNRYEFIKLPLRLINETEQYNVRRNDPFFVDFWKYGDTWPAINNNIHLEVGHDEKYRYIVPARARRAHKIITTIKEAHA